MAEVKSPNGRRALVEGHDVMLPRGTGIATYAKGLTSAMRDSGMLVDLLVSSNRRIPTDDRQLAEILLFDEHRPRDLTNQGYMTLMRTLGAPLGLRPGVVDGPMTVVSGQDDRLRHFERIYAVPRLIDVEKLHFQRWKRRLKLKIDRRYDLFHATRPTPIQVGGIPNIYTVHDIVPLRFPNTTEEDKSYFAAMIRTLASTADHIVTVSEFSRNDIIEFTGMSPDRISNTYQSVSFPDAYVARSVEQVATSLEDNYGLQFGEYYLFVGAIEPKKNISRLVDAYASSGVKRPLVLAGGLGWMYAADLERINSERFVSYVVSDRRIIPRRSVRRLPYLPAGHVVDLIRGARALVYPSIYEGFGLPAAEAMLLGTPVITSNVASLPEVTDGAAVLVDPYDVADIAKAISRVDADADLRQELALRGPQVAARYSPSEHARRLAALYAKLA